MSVHGGTTSATQSSRTPVAFNVAAKSLSSCPRVAQGGESHALGCRPPPRRARHPSPQTERVMLRLFPMKPSQGVLSKGLATASPLGSGWHKSHIAPTAASALLLFGTQESHCCVLQRITRMAALPQLASKRAIVKDQPCALTPITACEWAGGYPGHNCAGAHHHAVADREPAFPRRNDDGRASEPAVVPYCNGMRKLRPCREHMPAI